MRKTVLLLLAVAGGSAWAADSTEGPEPSPLVKYFQPYAIKGNVSAQLSLGSSYYNGKVVPQDYLEAARWFRMAAQQGDATAQNYLALMYLNGQGVAEDPVRAYMWSDLAAASGKETMMISREELAQMHEKLATRMSPQQVAEAQKMAQACRANNFQGCD